MSKMAWHDEHSKNVEEATRASRHLYDGRLGAESDRDRSSDEGDLQTKCLVWEKGAL